MAEVQAVLAGLQSGRGVTCVPQSHYQIADGQWVGEGGLGWPEANQPVIKIQCIQPLQIACNGNCAAERHPCMQCLAKLNCHAAPTS